jgi:NAD(P)-dependent dehydrogenase (short-subunit alcohol dehydrogenase family)
MLPQGTEVRSYLVNVGSRESVFSYADAVCRDFGAAHYVVNNAGTSVIARFQNITIEEIQKVIDVNLWGVIYGTNAFLPPMLKQREGCIVNISSVFGLVATPGSVAYTISKFGVRGLTETLWQELDGSGVRAVLVHPGGINTNIPKNTPKAQAEGEFERRVMEANKKQMITPPADCARDIVAGLAAGQETPSGRQWSKAAAPAVAADAGRLWDGDEEEARDLGTRGRLPLITDKIVEGQALLGSSRGDHSLSAIRAISRPSALYYSTRSTP